MRITQRFNFFWKHVRHKTTLLWGENQWRCEDVKTCSYGVRMSHSLTELFMKWQVVQIRISFFKIHMFGSSSSFSSNIPNKIPCSRYHNPSHFLSTLAPSESFQLTQPAVITWRHRVQWNHSSANIVEMGTKPRLTKTRWTTCPPLLRANNESINPGSCRGGITWCPLCGEGVRSYIAINNGGGSFSSRSTLTGPSSYTTGNARWRPVSLHAKRSSSSPWRI